MRRLVIDIETNLKHDTIWCAVTQDVDTGEVMVHTRPHTLKSLLSGYDLIIGHNIIGFDAPVLRKVWNINIRIGQVYDTLVASRLANPTQKGGHSLKNWGKIMGNDKINFDAEDFDGGLTDEMLEYCKQDVALNVDVYLKLVDLLKDWRDIDKVLELEHKVSAYMTRQERTGFNFNVKDATILQAELADRMAQITDDMQEVFPPIVEERWSEKTGKRLKDKVTRFNVGSRKQIGERLTALGWQPKAFTETGMPKIDESTMEDCEVPQAKVIAEYLKLQKIESFLASWLKNVMPDGRIYGKVISTGTVTHRMSHHSPNLAQVPSVSSLYGAECRQLFTADKDWVMVGADLSGIELRCLAHYMQDEEYIRQILEGDIHTYNQKKAGIADRGTAKRFIYAFLYGAGAGLLGEIVGKSSSVGGKLKAQLLRNLPKLATLIDKVIRISQKSKMETTDGIVSYIPALDGRRIQVNSEHSALNMLLQSAGAIITRHWIVETHRLMNANGISYKQLAVVHDEIQATVPPEQAEKAGQLMVEAARIAGEKVKLRIPVDAEYQIGKTWLDTH